MQVITAYSTSFYRTDVYSVDVSSFQRDDVPRKRTPGALV